ncbi:DUF4433 domain-containing protein [Nodosilinea sp. PGN35]|uniref:type II toxin-antitoxin system toxin DNA ADP-ribosyl transferase DarT n=1 Tax=Nodosilinea sp. PGN35 TaxID=3020489 RepID=UPI0023B257F7|nr:DUF4433 domain-containing protein [Nodosilinea sp. TSF1-S3]MDF0369686.1 DUF4433 domain-containing protein [Nodosilinea sp. TSF1-S3]
MAVWLYHITPISNLATIVQAGTLLAKNRLQASEADYTSIAYEHIQDRRYSKAVPCGPGGVLHDYVPFYFAPRSPMLGAIHIGNVTGYTSGQQSILHLVTTAEAIAEAGLGFVFSDGHAVMGYTSFYDDLNDIDTAIDWEIMQTRYWRDTEEDGDRKRRRQAEFLVHQAVPWPLIRGIGVMDEAIAAEVNQILRQFEQTMTARLRPQWYYT